MPDRHSFLALLNGFRLSAILTALVELLLGIFLILNPGAGKAALCSLLGFGILIFGIFSIVSWVYGHNTLFDTAHLTAGICASVLGLIFLVNPDFLFDFTALILGLFIIVCAIGELRRAMTLYQFGFTQWWLSLAAGILALLFGCSFVLFSRWYGSALLVAIGIILVLSAVSDLITIHRISKTSKDSDINIVIRY